MSTTAAAPKSRKSTKAPAAEAPEQETPAQEVAAPKLHKLKFVPLTIALNDLTFSKKVQAREKLDKDTLADYTALATEAKVKGADSPFPALKAVRRNGDILVFSGFTRGEALRKAGYTETRVEVADSEDIEDSELFVMAVAANRENASRPNASDRLHNLHRLLSFPEYAALPNTAIAPIAGVSDWFVGKHRPKGNVKVDKKGRVLSKRGAGRKAKASKKAVAAAAANAASTEGLDADLEVKPTTAAPQNKTAEAASRSLRRIANLLEGYSGFKGSEISKAVEDGTIKVSAADLIAWAETSDARVKQIAPLVINKGWSPKKAFSHIDKEITADTKVVHLINSAITTGGYTKDVQKTLDAAVGEDIVGDEPYKVLVWDTTKFLVKVTQLTK